MTRVSRNPLAKVVLDKYVGLFLSFIYTCCCNSKNVHFLKRFDKLSIDWRIVENKLRSWSNSGLKLKAAISLIYKEVQPANNGSKTGRGATKKHSAALEKLVARQEASGARAVWGEQ